MRPWIAAEPFSTSLVLDRTAIPKDERFFLYPVHVSSSFLLTKGINSAVYLLLLRLLHRDYAEAFRLADGIATDTKLNAEGQTIFAQLATACLDLHPDAHACRLKISVVTIDSGMSQPWDLTLECGKTAAAAWPRLTVPCASYHSPSHCKARQRLRLLPPLTIGGAVSSGIGQNRDRIIVSAVFETVPICAVLQPSRDVTVCCF